MSIVSSTSTDLYVDAICDKRQHLFENGDAFLRGRLVDDERRVDADVGVVAHRDEPPLEAFLEYEFARFLVELLVRRAVLHELDPDEEPASPHLADERKLLLEPREPVEHERANARGILDKPLVE